jgi:alpha-galactosidase
MSNMPPTAIVQVPAATGAAGITGRSVGPLPVAIAAVQTVRAQQQEVTVRAALVRDRDLAVRPWALDPRVPDPSPAAAILDDAVAAPRSSREPVAAAPVAV